MTTKFSYNIYSLLLNLSVAIICVLMFVYLIYETLFSGNYIGYAAMAIFLIVASNFSIKSFRNTCRFLKRNPAIELNEIFIFDHQSNVKHSWINIHRIYLKTRKNITFLELELVDKSEFIEQLKNPEKFLMRNFSEVLPVQICLSSINGRNKDLFKLVNDYFSTYKATHNRRFKNLLVFGKLNVRFYEESFILAEKTQPAGIANS